MPSAVRVSRVNVNEIVALVNDPLIEIKDEVEFNESMGFFATVLVKDGCVANRNLVYTMFTEEGFNQYWKFSTTEVINQFTSIERKQ